MKVLVTGAAGFIGSALSIRLLDRGDEVIGIDNHNDYYDPDLKEARLARHESHSNYTHIRMDIEDGKAVAALFEEHQFDGVVNLAAQAGVRYSIEIHWPTLTPIWSDLVIFWKVAGIIMLVISSTPRVVLSTALIPVRLFQSMIMLIIP